MHFSRCTVQHREVRFMTSEFNHFLRKVCVEFVIRHQKNQLFIRTSLLSLFCTMTIFAASCMIISIGWFLKRFYLVFLGSSWFPRKKKILLEKAKTKSYLWASFHDIWSMSKSSKLDIWKAISAKKTMIWKLFLWKNKHYNVVVLVPNFYLSARSSSIFLAFILHVYGEPF